MEGLVSKDSELYVSFHSYFEAVYSILPSGHVISMFTSVCSEEGLVSP